MSDSVTVDKVTEPGSPLETRDKATVGNRRTRLVYTIFILLVYFVEGALKGQEGVSFLDLLIITDSDIESGSLLLTCSALGYMLGYLCLGFLYDRFNNTALFSAFILLSGLITFLIPWCNHLILMSAAFVVRSLVNSAVDIGVIVLTVKLWKNEVNPYMQAIQAMFALGGIVSPLITAPFLSHTEPENYTNATNGTYGFNSSYTLVTSENTSRLGENEYSAKLSNLSSYSFMGNGFTIKTVVTSNQTSLLRKEETRVYVAYSIIGACMIAVFIPIFLFWVSKFSSKLKELKAKTLVHETPARGIKKKNKSKLRLLAIALVGLYFFAYGPIEKTSVNFLQSFLHLHLKWSKTRAAQGCSAFYAGFAGGRFLGIALAVVMSTTSMILVFMIALIVSLGLFIFAVGHSANFVWACTILLGAAMSTIYASVYAWVDSSLISVSGKMASCMQVTFALGAMATTPLLGYLFKEQTPMWFLYLTIINASICLVTYGILYKLSSTLRARDSCKSMETGSYLYVNDEEKNEVTLLK